jgi:hypothetical protein
MKRAVLNALVLFLSDTLLSRFLHVLTVQMKMGRNESKMYRI